MKRVNGCGGVGGIYLCHTRLAFLLEGGRRSNGAVDGGGAKEGKGCE